MRTKFLFIGVAVLAVGGLTACADMLGIENTNNPDLERVYNTPTDIEGVMGTLYRTFHQSVQGAADGLNAQSKSMSSENHGQVANFGMNIRNNIPRIDIQNSPGNQVAGGNFANFSSLSRLSRTASVATQAVDRMLASLGTMGSNARNQRARSFGFFINGIATGHLALGYDSIGVVTIATAGATIPPLASYAAAMDTAVRMLDSALAIINAIPVAEQTEAFIPGTWMGGGGQVDLTHANYVRLIRSYRARLRAGVARTPVERAAVNWALVLADAQAGITAHHTVVLTNTAPTWSSGLDAGAFQTSTSWHQLSLMYAGMADTSGAYQTYVNGARIGMDVVVQTPDTRWPAGATRAAQNAVSTLPLPVNRYIANRNPGGDQPDNGNPHGSSQYDHRRWWAIANNNGNGTYVFMSRFENDMLAAEAHIAMGNGALALPLVNASRAVGGLPPFVLATDLAPGTTGCVPRLPNGTCGTLREAMKYEKRMETQMTGYMQWFVDSRGWGDLIQGTSLHWPVPFNETNTRNIPYYDMPSAGTLGRAPVGTYGF